ncbi:hypothetical protein CfE428DRAFT_6415 [Chthoniobacter flavus Ellin428]|uniref:Uncharacterized protein n=1 Tax=Chthoniobacter flavus Ellin428 TaxID=497964 RepID=B4DBX4_9BACT|nr:hypothetical protein [Chthoniobacter flavus]EDY16021.1 hypothetical protein CfE428DRAFT_6415 [Chthoniobacter flavus Ellin428]TCO87759.1 hypothetical protein EV701_12058 [Chthoniobacter flavus]
MKPFKLSCDFRPTSRGTITCDIVNLGEEELRIKEILLVVRTKSGFGIELPSDYCWREGPYQLAVQEKIQVKFKGTIKSFLEINEQSDDDPLASFALKICFFEGRKVEWPAISLDQYAPKNIEIGF